MYIPGIGDQHSLGMEFVSPKVCTRQVRTATRWVFPQVIQPCWFFETRTAINQHTWVPTLGFKFQTLLDQGFEFQFSEIAILARRKHSPLIEWLFWRNLCRRGRPLDFLI
jgi:hypothetical protein